ncbi:MAG: beta-Ala-His dipeptidase [Synergistaceae bacterium]|jgi:dipeptidase D|nr:beta-Ala-His dipeptidase [Synergistaceae bacterium]
MYSFEDLKRLRFYRHFGNISSIPRGSGGEKAVSDYLLRFAEELGLDCRQDEALNVIIKKKAAPGYEKEPAVVLQAHMDMVCEKTADSGHDFTKDPIVPLEKDGYLTADGTTLGADNGVGVACIMAILEDETLKHPALEAVITTNEEVGMEGMSQLDASAIEGTRMINLDSEREGTFSTSCAGGARIQMTLPIARSLVPMNALPCALRVQGLTGGHSGVDIGKNRANAIVLLGRAIALLQRKIGLHVENLSGGGKLNAIPREAAALLWLEESQARRAMSETENIGKIFEMEYKVSEPALTLDLMLNLEDLDRKEAVFRGEALTRQSLRNVLAAISLLPCGVLGFSQYLQGEVDSSCNLGIVETAEEAAVFSLMARSNTNSKMDDIVARTEHLGNVLQAEVKISNSYPAWEFRGRSPLREICVREFTALYGKPPKLASIHGGLECALMTLKKPDMDMISLGPTILDAHTPNERVEIASSIHMWELIVRILYSYRK